MVELDHHWSIKVHSVSAWPRGTRLIEYSGFLFPFYYIDESVLLGTKPLVDSIRHYIQDPSVVFSVCHLCECHIVQWHQVLSLKLYLIRWCIIETSSGLPRKSSAIFGNLWTSLEVFGNSRKMFRNARLVFGTILENVWKSSEGGRKSSENHQKRCY